MAKTYKEIRECVITKVRTFCFAGASITDDQIAETSISSLHLSTNPNMPGVSPLDALAISLRECADISIPGLTGDKLNSPGWKVETVAQFIYSF